MEAGLAFESPDGKCHLLHERVTRFIGRLEHAGDGEESQQCSNHISSGGMDHVSSRRRDLFHSEAQAQIGIFISQFS